MACATPATRSSCDLLIRSATLIDGTGDVRRHADIAVDRGRIVAIGTELGMVSDQVIQADGKVVCPGFIDVHTHDDRAALEPDLILPKLSQGVTTVVTGNCGISVAPYAIARTPPPLDLIMEEGQAPSVMRFPTFDAYMQALKQTPLSINVMPLVGHTSLRVQALSDIDRPADHAEIQIMQRWVDEAMQAGAWGMSTGTFYPPARAASTGEIIEVGRPLTAAKGLYATHLRDEADQILAAMAEAFEIGRTLDVGVVLSHHKLAGVCNHGRSTETLAMVTKAARSQPVALDCYPYHASSTVLRPEFLHRALRTRVTWSKAYPDMAGRMLDDIAQAWGVSQEEAASRLLPAGAIYYAMDEQDVQRILAYDATMIGSDGIPHDQIPHPRLWGTFPRVLGHYARDLGLFSLEAAVHKMSGRAAQTFGLTDRGVVKIGAWADLVLFDPATVRDVASFEDPQQPAQGIEWVLVNGQIAYQPGVGRQAMAGQALVRPH